MFNRCSILGLAAIGCGFMLCLSRTPLPAGTIRDDVADSNYTALAAQSEYAAVGKLQMIFGSSSYIGSATLISSRWILTAGHCVYDTTDSPASASSVNFVLGGTTYTGASWTYNPGWDGSTLSSGTDIALVRFTSPITSVAPAVRYAGNSEIGQTATMVGYGRTGTGLTGDTLAAGTRRAGQNVLDKTGSYYGESSNILYTDFDNPHSTATNHMGSSTPISLEYATAPGDSGGGWFIGTGASARLAGVTSFGASFDGDTDSSYGDLSAATRVSAFNNWIDDTIAAQWNNAAGGATATAGNWQNSYLPDSTDILSFYNNTGAYTVTFSGANSYNKILARRGTVTVDLGGTTQTVNSPMLNGSVVVARDSTDTAQLTLTNGNLQNVDAFVAVASGANGTVTLTGSGTQWNLSDSLYVGGSSSAAGGIAAVTVGAGTTLAVDGTLKLWNSSATLTVDGTATAGQLAITTGTLNGSGNITISGLTTWLNGTMSGSGTTICNGGMTFSGSGDPKLDGRTLVNTGVATFSSANYLHGLNGAVLNNQAGATIELTGTNQFRNDGGTLATLNNTGTFRKKTSTGISTIDFVLNNTGLIDVQTGTLTFTKGGTSPGTFNVASGATLSFSGTDNLTGATFTNAGTLSFGGSANLAATTFTNSGTVAFTAGTNTFSPVSLNNTGTVSLSGGTATLAAGSYGGNVTLGGATLASTGDVTFTGPVTWTSGTMDVGGKTVIPAGNTLTIANATSYIYLYRPLQNNGTVTWTGTKWFFADKSGASGSIDNQPAATFDAQADGTLDYLTSTRGTFNNAGLFKKSGGTGTTTVNWTFNNTGNVDVQSGTLSITSGGASPGTFHVASGAALSFSGTDDLTGATFTNAGTLTFAAGTNSFSPTSLSNTGTVAFTGGTATLAAGSYGGNVTLGGATLASTGDVTFTGPVAWTSGTMDVGGTTVIPAGNSLAISTATYSVYLYRVLENAGTITWTGTHGIAGDKTGAAGTINNQAGATFDAQASGTLFYFGYGRGTFNNAGLFKRSGGTGTTSVQWAFNNTGTVDVQNGTLSLSGGGTSPGTFNVASGAALSFSGTNDLAGATFTNAGTLTFAAGTNSFSPTSLSNTGIVNVQSGKLSVAHGIGDGGAASPAGTIHVAAGAELEAKNLRQAALTLDGKATVAERAGTQADTVSVIGTTLAINASTGLLNLQDSDLIIRSGAGQTEDSIRSLIAAGYGNGQDWSGTSGLTSTSAGLNPTYYGLGYGLVSKTRGPSATTFDGQPVAQDDLLVKYTYKADLNLDGLVNGNDVIAFAAGYGKGSAWTDGNLTYHAGPSNGNDVIAFAAAYNSSLGMVPEPGVLVLVGCAGLGLQVGRWLRNRARRRG